GRRERACGRGGGRRGAGRLAPGRRRGAAGARGERTERNEGGDPGRARGSMGPLHLVMLAGLARSAFARLRPRRWPMAELEWTTEPVGAWELADVVARQAAGGRPYL